MELRGRDLRYADFYKSRLWDADLREARLEGADLSSAQLQGANLLDAQLQDANLYRAQLEGARLSKAQLQGADLEGEQLQGAVLREAQLQGAVLRRAVVYGTRFRDAELLLADLRGLRLPRDEWEGLSSVFSAIEKLEARLEQEGKHWPRHARNQVEQVIDRLWSVAFDLQLKPTAISPLQGSNMMYDQRGLFADWPAPPEVAEFEQARADYRAGLACNNRYIAENMWRYATEDRWWLIGSYIPVREKADQALKQALRAKADSGACPDLAEVLSDE